jgi:hypothetical protein
MTLDAARIDLRKAFVEGMGYVALSRVRGIDTLYLHGINRLALTVSEQAMAIDEQLRARTARDSEKFAHLQKQAEERAKQPEKMTKKSTKKSASWKDKIEKMRETYPNAYKPWTKQQDADLSLGFTNGESLQQLSKKLGRHEGSIKMRLQKLFGEDTVRRCKESGRIKLSQLSEMMAPQLMVNSESPASAVCGRTRLHQTTKDNYD